MSDVYFNAASFSCPCYAARFSKIYLRTGANLFRFVLFMSSTCFVLFQIICICIFLLFDLAEA